ncbi:MAG: Hpt domain-containing protein [Candidatus Binatia bacterium]
MPPEFFHRTDHAEHLLTLRSDVRNDTTRTSGVGAQEPLGLDPTILDDLVDLEREGRPFLAGMIRTFLDGALRSIADLRRAASEGAAEVVATIAHQLQGSSGALGARAMSDTCARLQRMGKTASLAGADELIERLDREVSAIRPELERVLAHLVS